MNRVRKNNKVLVIEDAAPDRLRFRSILEQMDLDFCFAWNAKEQQVPEVEEVMTLIEKKIKPPPTALVLDLAWTTHDNKILRELMFRDKEQIKELASQNKPWISGFRLLKEIRKKQDSPQIRNLTVIVTTQYIPPVAYGLVQYLDKEFSLLKLHVIHKWSDVGKLRDYLDKVG